MQRLELIPRAALTCAAIVVLSLVACGEDGNAGNAGNAPCGQIGARLRACGMRPEARPGCGRLTSSCEATCLAGAPCDDLFRTACGPGAPPTGLVACVAACRAADAGIQHDPRADETGVEAFFPCKDGSGVVTFARVCDAVPNCRDGSDERVCSYASCGPGAAGDAGSGPSGP